MLEGGAAQALAGQPLLPLTADHLALHTKQLPAPSRPRPTSASARAKLEAAASSTLTAERPTSSKEPDNLTVSLLRVSPPIPVGTLPGRYKVRLWRADRGLPWGLAFASRQRRGTVVAQDAAHLGIRKGDEVLSINKIQAGSPGHCTQLLEGGTAVEILLYHREPSALAATVTELRDPMSCSCPGHCTPGTWCYCAPATCGHDAVDIDPYYDGLFYPRTSQVAASKFCMQDMLRTSGRLHKEGEDVVQVHLLRTSLEQRFPFSLREAWQPGEDQHSHASLPVETKSGCTLASTTASSSMSPVDGGTPAPTSRSSDTEVGEAASAPATREEARQEEEEEEEAAEEPIAEGRQQEAAEESGGLEGAGCILILDGECGPSKEMHEEKLVEPEPSSTAAPGVVLVQEPWAWLGLREGDQVLRVNGVAAGDFDACQELFREAMSLKLELQPAAVAEGEEGSLSEFAPYDEATLARFPPHWARGLVEEEDVHCLPVPVVSRRSGERQGGVQGVANAATLGTFGWLLHSLGFSTANQAGGGPCFCSGPLEEEEAEPFNLSTADILAAQPMEATQSGPEATRSAAAATAASPSPREATLPGV